MYSIDLPWACFELIAEGTCKEDAMIIESAQIAAWCTGRQLTDILRYWQKRGATIERCSTGGAT